MPLGKPQMQRCAHFSGPTLGARFAHMTNNTAICIYMDTDRSIAIYTKVIARLFSNAHQPYTTTRDYKKIANSINEILQRLISDNGFDYAMVILQRVSLATRKPFGPLDSAITMEIIKRGGNITSCISV